MLCVVERMSDDEEINEICEITHTFSDWCIELRTAYVIPPYKG